MVRKKREVYFRWASLFSQGFSFVSCWCRGRFCSTIYEKLNIRYSLIKFARFFKIGNNVSHWFSRFLCSEYSCVQVKSSKKKFSGKEKSVKLRKRKARLHQPQTHRDHLQQNEAMAWQMQNKENEFLYTWYDDKSPKFNTNMYPLAHLWQTFIVSHFTSIRDSVNRRSSSFVSRWNKGHVQTRNRFFYFRRAITER